MNQNLTIFMVMKKNFLIKKMKMKKILKQTNNMKTLINIWKNVEKI